jgi:hypothetical protein
MISQLKILKILLTTLNKLQPKQLMNSLINPLQLEMPAMKTLLMQSLQFLLMLRDQSQLLLISLMIKKKKLLKMLKLKLKISKLLLKISKLKNKENQLSLKL